MYVMKNNKFSLSIHVDLLPVKPNKELLEGGYIHGDLFFNELDDTASFMNNGTTVFKCSRPVVMLQTNTLIKYSACVYIDTQETKCKPCHLTFHFNF